MMVEKSEKSIPERTSASFTMLALDVWGVEETKEYMRQLVKQEPAITRDRRLQAEWVARGKYALSVATNLENMIEFIGWLIEAVIDRSLSMERISPIYLMPFLPCPQNRFRSGHFEQPAG